MGYSNAVSDNFREQWTRFSFKELTENDLFPDISLRASDMRTERKQKKFDNYNDLNYEILNFWDGLTKKIITVLVITGVLGYCRRTFLFKFANIGL